MRQAYAGKGAVGDAFRIPAGEPSAYVSTYLAVEAAPLCPSGCRGLRLGLRRLCSRALVQVSQLDAARLDTELLQLIRDQLVEVFSGFRSGCFPTRPLL